MSGLLSKPDFLREIKEMDPYRFEKFVAEVWDQQGFETTLRSKSGDRGIDVVAEDGQQKHLLQVKRYTGGNKVGSEEVRKYATLYQQVGDADQVDIVTSGHFTDEALQLATDLSVGTVDGEELFYLVNSSAPEVAVKYLHSSDLEKDAAGVVSPNSVDKPRDNVGEQQSSVITCEHCGEDITDSKQEYITHWADCELPEYRPSKIPVDTWWEIKDEVTEGADNDPFEDFEYSGSSSSQQSHRISISEFSAVGDKLLEDHLTAVLAITGLILAYGGFRIATVSEGIIQGIFYFVGLGGAFLLIFSYLNAKEAIES